MNKRSTKGFTIVELLIVVVVIAILAAIVVVSYNGITVNARNTARVQTVSAIVNGMKLYQAKAGEAQLRALVQPAPGVYNNCIGTDYQDVDPGPAHSCRYQETDAGVTTGANVNQPLADAIASVSKFKLDYEPVTQTNFMGMKYVISSAPFYQYTPASAGYTYQVDSGSPSTTFGLLSYRLEGADQDCKMPVVALVQYNSAESRYYYESGVKNSAVNGGATECWVWLDFI